MSQSSATSIREAFATKISEQLSGRQARLFQKRSRYRERVIDEAIEQAIAEGMLDPREAFESPDSVVAEIMGETVQKQSDGERPPRDWATFWESFLKPFLEWLMQLLSGLGAL